MVRYRLVQRKYTHDSQDFCKCSSIDVFGSKARMGMYRISQWLFVLEQYAEFGLLFVLQWEYLLQLSEKYSSFSISIILL